MKKIFFLIIIVLTLILVSGLALLSRLGTSPHGLLFQTIPTPTPVGSPRDIVKSSLQLISLVPPNKAVNVPIDQTIEATFNKDASRISFALYPDTQYSLATQGSTLTVSFPQKLEVNTVYAYSFLDASGKIIASGTFTTGLPSDSTAPLSASYDNLEETANASQRENYPDVFLASYTPYDAASFSVTSDFTSQEPSHFFFTVTQKNANGKKDFLTWLTSLGLTDTEIQKLDIRY